MTPKQRLFVERYLVHLCARTAAQEAGYSPKSATQQGSRLLQTPAVRTVIDAVAADRAARSQVERDDVLRELLVILGSSIDDYEIDAEGRVRVRPGVPASAIRAVSSVRFHREFDFDGKLRSETVKLTLWDKPKTLQLAMRRLGLLRDRLELDLATNNVHIYVPDNGRSAKQEERADEPTQTH